jgi:nuclear pore complex protein Nup155
MRIEYLSRAKANASTRVPTFGRLNNSRQEVLRDIGDQLDNASVQQEVLQRLEKDERLQTENRTRVLQKLNGRVMTLDEVCSQLENVEHSTDDFTSQLYHEFVFAAGYHDICLVIYHLSDYRNSADIAATWQNFIQETHQEESKMRAVEPHDVVQEKVRAIGRRVNCSETVFNPRKLYSNALHEYQATNFLT